MTDKQIIINKMDKPKRYCEGIDCAWCDEKEPCIYKIANDLEEKLLRKEQECEKLKWYLKEIRDDELRTLDIEWDEYETHCIDTEYTNIINLVEEALEERSPEDCRYGK